MEPSISIIVPFKNSGKTIQRCLESILKIDYDFSLCELLLVDDHSEDNTLEIINSFLPTDISMQIIDSETYGVSGARNTGIERSSKDFITFVDSDDYVESNFLREFVDILNAGFQFPITGIAKTENVSATSASTVALSVDQAKNWLLRNDKFEGYVFNKLFNRKLIFDYDVRFKEGLKFSEDLLFCFEYLGLLEGSIGYNEVQSYHYIDNPLSAMNSIKVGTGSFEVDNSGLEVLKIIDETSLSAANKSLITDRLVWEYSLMARRIFAASKTQKLPASVTEILQDANNYVKRHLGAFMKHDTYSSSDKLKVLGARFAPEVLYCLQTRKSVKR